MFGLKTPDTRLCIALVLILGLVAILLLGGCSPASIRLEMHVDAYGPGYAGSDDIRPVIPVEHRVDLDDVHALSLTPKWTLRFGDNVDMAISPLGDRVAVAVPRGRALELRVYAPDGSWLWSKQFYNHHKLAPRFLHKDGYLGAWLHDRETRGTYYVYAPDGKLLLSQAVQGALTARMSDDGSRLILVEHSQRRLRMFDLNGKLVATHSVARGSGVRFVPGSAMVLIEDDSEMRVLDQGGVVIRRYPLNRDLRRSVLPSPDGTRMAVTTGLSDNSLHMYTPDGQQLWSHLLLPGGNNDLVFNSSGDRILVYNVGRRGGLYMLDASNGELLWRTSLDIDPDSQLVTWRDMLFSSDGRHVVGHLGIRDTIRIQVSERSLLVIISIDGVVEAKATLGSNLEVALSRDGSVLAVADGTHSRSIYVLDTVRYYDLAWLLEHERGERGD